MLSHSDPKHWDFILSFTGMNPRDVSHCIALTDVVIHTMHVVDGSEDDDVPVDVLTTR